MKLNRISTAMVLIASLAVVPPAGAVEPATPPEPAKQPEPVKHAAHAVGKDKAPAHSKSDFIALGTTTVTGNRELPKVMYIVPWKKSDIGDLSGKPVNSLLDEVLAPVDRDVFRREIVYYHVLSAAAPQNGGAPSATAKQGEK